MDVLLVRRWKDTMLVSCMTFSYMGQRDDPILSKSKNGCFALLTMRYKADPVRGDHGSGLPGVCGTLSWQMFVCKSLCLQETKSSTWQCLIPFIFRTFPPADVWLWASSIRDTIPLFDFCE